SIVFARRLILAILVLSFAVILLEEKLNLSSGIFFRYPSSSRNTKKVTVANGVVDLFDNSITWRWTTPRRFNKKIFEFKACSSPDCATDCLDTQYSRTKQYTLPFQEF